MKDFTDELIALCRVFGVFEREAVCCGSVTVPQCVVMQALLGGGSDIGSLARHAGASPSAMTRLVDGLERKGWVRRERAEDDRRRVDVVLTEEGAAEARRLRAATDACVQAVLARIPKPEHAAVLDAMRRVRVAMTDVRDAVCCGG